MRTLRGEAFQQRRAAIIEKYEPLCSLYHQWLETANQATRAAGWPNLTERNNLLAYQHGEGLEHGLDLLRWHHSYNKAVKYLQEAVAEPSMPAPVRKGVQLILHDLLADELQPLEAHSFLLTDRLPEAMQVTQRSGTDGH
jgi:hypothetical protein